MLRKILCVVGILAISIGFAVADEFKGKVTKVSGTKITVENKKDNKTMDFDIVGAKVQKVAKGEAPAAAEASAVKEGANVMIKYDGTKVSEVNVVSKKK